MKTPSSEELDLAIAWLSYYEGDNAGDIQKIKNVIDWLEKKSFEKNIKDTAKSYGVSVAITRKLLEKEMKNG